MQPSSDQKRMHSRMEAGLATFNTLSRPDDSPVVSGRSLVLVEEEVEETNVMICHIE